MANILVVDDQSVSLEIHRGLLETVAGQDELHLFTCPADALSWAMSNPIELIITDYRMPTMNGIRLTEKIREFDHLFAIPVIMVTADDDAQLRDDALRAGVAQVLLKPVDHYEYKTACCKFLGKPMLRRSAG